MDREAFKEAQAWARRRLGLERYDAEREAAKVLVAADLDDPDPAAVVRSMREHLGPHFAVEHGVREVTTDDGRMLEFSVRVSSGDDEIGVVAKSEVPVGLLDWAGEARTDFERGVWTALCYEAPMALFERLSAEVLGDG